MRITKASKQHASLIAQGVMMALGEDICEKMGDNASMVCKLFTTLASRTDSQYSYNNTYVALDDNGEVMGLVVSYPGSELERLREAFFEEVNKLMGSAPRNIPDETDAEEYYLDTLAVWPQYRGKGVASKLIDAVHTEASKVKKPVGLLVDKSNLNARKLYDKIGFRKVGERYFMHEMMDHLQL